MCLNLTHSQTKTSTKQNTYTHIHSSLLYYQTLLVLPSGSSPLFFFERDLTEVKIMIEVEVKIMISTHTLTFSLFTFESFFVSLTYELN